LNSARAKLARAGKHFHTLQVEIPAFIRERRYSVIHEVDADRFYHRWKVPLGEPFPEEWGLIVGDFAHNARSALDHIAWQLAGADPADTWTQFPLYAEETKFGHASRVMKTIPHRPLALVKWLQPYRRPEPLNDPLWWLHTLDAEDKHKTITVMLAAMIDANVEPMVPPKSRLRHQIIFNPGPFDPAEAEAVIAEGEIIVTPLDGSPPHTDVKVDFEATFGVAIRADTARMTLLPGLPNLHRILVCAWDVWGKFLRYT
jgi:hypothetical protein